MSDQLNAGTIRMHKTRHRTLKWHTGEDYGGQMVSVEYMSLKFSDICLTGDLLKPVLTKNRTRPTALRSTDAPLLHSGGQLTTLKI